MKCRVMLLLCVLAAGSARAGGITSFEPDTTARVSRDREPMVDTPIWLGSSWTVSSEYQADARGLTRGPVHFNGLGFGATWPWRSRLQGYAEWQYGVRHIRYVAHLFFFNGVENVPYTDEFTDDRSMFALRGGTEYRFGRRSTPWCTAGGGVGYALDAGPNPASAFELTARTTLFTYPSRNMRLGLMLSAGPMWFAHSGPLAFTIDGINDHEPVRTHFEIALRFDRRLRFPKANADADAAE